MNTDEMILYRTEDGETRIEARFTGDTVWLSLNQLAELFQRDKSVISRHLKSIFQERELDPVRVVADYATTAADGKTYQVAHYRLEAILAVGYRVNSPRGVAFRQWATERLREYIVKGFAMDDERLKNPGRGVTDYFDEMLARIRDIRSAERRMYLQVRNILALAADYEPNDEETNRFFQIAQNKLHFAATGKTAPELIAERADHAKPNMGLTVWKGGVVRKGDVTIAKNYLNEEEIDELNRIVTMFLDYAEDQARRRKQVFMRDWRDKLDEFLRFNERRILPNAGRVTREEADQRAMGEYDQFNRLRLEQVDAAAEADTMKALEEMARELPRTKRTRAKKDTRK